MTKLDRRTFLKWSGVAAGAALVPATALRATADTGDYTGLFLVTVHAGGAWDPLFLCDPKDDATMNRVTTASAMAGAIRYADHAIDPVALGYDGAYATEYAANMMTNRDFFERNRARTVVLNGVDTRTNNHDTGSRFVWSGHSPIGHPSIGALAAAAGGADRPLSFVSQGGYDVTAGLVPLARITDAGSMARIAEPNVIDPNDPESESYHSGPVYQRILDAQRARLTSLRERNRLPAIQRAMARLETARLGTVDLEQLVLPETLTTIPGYQLGDLQRMMQQTQLAMSAFGAGVSVAASLTLGGFDTHGSHDRDHVRQLAKLLRGVDYVVEQAAAAGLADRVVIVVGSDFGRGPLYNGTNEYSGKDHWPTTSMMVLLPDGVGGGDRVIGATDEQQRPLKLDPGSLAVNEDGASLTPSVIHRSLRKLLALESTEGTARYPLLGEDMPLFG